MSGNFSATIYLGGNTDPVDWTTHADDRGQIQVTAWVRSGSLCLYGDPAAVLRELDAARQLVIDHLVDTVGIPATVIAERKLLDDILHEVGPDLPSPLAHRLRSTIAGDQPEPTGRTTAAALTERQQDHGEVECVRCGRVFGGWHGPAGPDDPDLDEVFGTLCSTCIAGENANEADLVSAGTSFPNHMPAAGGDA